MPFLRGSTCRRAERLPVHLHRPGTFGFAVIVTDDSEPRPQSATAGFQITVQLPALTITSTSPLPNGTVAAAYSYSLTATGGTAPYTWTASGSLPPGLSLSSGGQITGTPSAGGTYQFSISVNDSAYGSAARGFVLTIQASQTSSAFAITSVSPLANGSSGAQPIRLHLRRPVELTRIAGLFTAAACLSGPDAFDFRGADRNSHLYWYLFFYGAGDRQRRRVPAAYRHIRRSSLRTSRRN